MRMDARHELSPTRASRSFYEAGKEVFNMVPVSIVIGIPADYCIEGVKFSIQFIHEFVKSGLDGVRNMK